MRTVTITRPIDDVAFRVGDGYEFAYGDEHFNGVICDLGLDDAAHWSITLEMTDDEHRQMLAATSS
jgi:hypothetical protein